VDSKSTYSASTPHQIQFQNNNAFAEPTILASGNSQNLNTAGVVGTTSGIMMATFNALPNKNLPGSSVTYEYHSLQFKGEPDVLGPGGAPFNITIEAQFQDSEGNWQTYQRFPYGLSNTPTYSPTLGDVNPPGGPRWTGIDLAYPQMALSRVDPRGSRWGAGRTYVDTAMYSADKGTPGTSLRTGSGSGTPSGEGTPVGPGSLLRFWPNGSRSWGDRNYGGMISDNDPSSESSATSTRSVGYKDPDSVGRRADGNTARDVLPMMAGRLLDRPVILNRPFRSVAEMGYVFRDMPWKTLDFSHGNSADAGLLDIFTAYDDVETPHTAVAGKVNLNTSRPEVLASLISGAAIREKDSSQNIASPTALQIARDLVAVTATNSLLNKSALITTFAKQKETTFDSSYLSRKAERESIIRALADVGQTRTWNLLIDVVAQTGRYPASATNLDEFTVEGERRYWMHVAIDRYTGDVIDSQLEPVYE
jgi:hypothetical protein